MALLLTFRGGGHPQSKLLKGFTMAEVLITLGIIGIVAAMTFPALLGKYQKVVTVNQLKKAYSILSQLVIQSQEDNGAAVFDSNASVDAETVKTFFNTYWLPYFNNPTVGKEYEFPYPEGNAYKKLNGETYSLGIRTVYGNARVYFTTNDGTSYFVHFMYWENKYDDDGNLVSQTAKYNSAQQVYVDLNGIKPPNVLGKDVFQFIVFFDDKVVRPYGYDKTDTYIKNNCSKAGEGICCAAKIMRDGWQIKRDYPW